MLKINVRDDLRMERVSPEDLPADWLQNMQATRAIGDTWLTQGATALLVIPSAIVPETSNVLLNPVHPDSKGIRIMHVSDHVIDPRVLA